VIYLNYPHPFRDLRKGGEVLFSLLDWHISDVLLLTLDSHVGEHPPFGGVQIKYVNLVQFFIFRRVLLSHSGRSVEGVFPPFNPL